MAKITKGSDPKMKRLCKGDRVRIVTPLVFVRCGYPLDFAAELPVVMDELGPKINAFLESVGILPKGRILGEGPSITFDKIAKALTYARLDQANFGGNRREIHTREVPEIAGVECYVEGTFSVKTGQRVPATRDYEGEYDPAYLSGEKTHRILCVCAEAWPFTRYQIEDIHVERIDIA